MHTIYLGLSENQELIFDNLKQLVLKTSKVEKGANTLTLGTVFIIKVIDGDYQRGRICHSVRCSHQPGFLIKATKVELLSSQKVEEDAEAHTATQCSDCDLEKRICREERLLLRG